LAYPSPFSFLMVIVLIKTFIMDLIDKKVEELIVKYDYTQGVYDLEAAIRCAIICVDEIINAFDDCSCSPILEGTLSVRDWQKVKERLLAKQ
jgi:hypothetical protein